MGCLSGIALRLARFREASAGMRTGSPASVASYVADAWALWRLAYRLSPSVACGLSRDRCVVVRSYYTFVAMIDEPAFTSMLIPPVALSAPCSLNVPPLTPVTNRNTTFI